MNRIFLLQGTKMGQFLTMQILKKKIQQSRLRYKWKVAMGYSDYYEIDTCKGIRGRIECLHLILRWLIRVFLIHFTQLRNAT